MKMKAMMVVSLAVAAVDDFVVDFVRVYDVLAE